MINLFRKYNGLTLCTAMVVIVAHIGFFAVIDPLMIVHRSADPDERFYGNLRIEAAGIINGVDFESLILGMSTSANFPSQFATELWHSRFVNLSEDGFTMFERLLVLRYALARKNLKHVILSADGFGTYGEGNPLYPLDSYAYLYNDSAMDNLKAYLGFAHLNKVGCLLLSRCSGAKSIDQLTLSLGQQSVGVDHWLDGKLNRRLVAAVSDIIRQADTAQSAQESAEGSLSEAEAESWNNRKKILDEYFLRTIREHPGTRFHILFPPHSRLSFTMELRADPASYATYLKTVKYLVDATDGYENVEVYGFEDQTFPDDTSNYIDTIHFSPDISKKLLIQMSGRQGILRPERVDEYLATIELLAAGYDAAGDAEVLRHDLAVALTRYSIGD